MLVNSKRRHHSALVNVNGSIGRGSAAVDLNAIPLAAHRDRRSAARRRLGAVRLRRHRRRDQPAPARCARRRQTSASPTASTTPTSRPSAASATRDDGATHDRSGWVGLPLGAEGFLTLSGEYRDRDPTSRGDFDNRVPGSPVTSRYGDARRRGHHRLRERGHAARERLEHLRLGGLPAPRRQLRRLPAHLQRRAQRAGYLPERLPAAHHHRHRRPRGRLGRARQARRLGCRRQRRLRHRTKSTTASKTASTPRSARLRRPSSTRAA